MYDFFKITRTSLGTNVRVLLAQLRGLGAEGDDDNAEPHDDVEVIYPLGLIARPYLTDHTEGVGFQDGDEVTLLSIIDKGLAKLGVTPELEEGETRLFGAKEPGAMIRIKANGSIAANAKDGQTITLTANEATVVVKANGDIVVTPKSGQKVFIGSDSSTQAMLMGDDVTTRLNDLKDACNANRSDIDAIKSHTHDTTCGSGPGSATPSSSLSSLPTASTVSAAPAQSTIAESA